MPDDWYEVPFGKAAIRRDGTDATIIGYSRMAHVAAEAAETLQTVKGVSAEVIDLRTLRPFDVETVVESVKRTGRAVVGGGGLANRRIRGGDRQHHTGRRVRLPRRPRYPRRRRRRASPYARRLEAAVIPDADRVIQAMEQGLGM